MTRFPTESRNVIGLEPDDTHPLYKVGPTCAVPGCTKLTDHAHHLFSRGLMGGAFDWVRLDDGTEVFNKVPLCYRHHEEVTNNEVAIEWHKDCFVWGGDDQPLSWQPPKIEPEQETVIIPLTQDEAKELGATPHRYCPTCKRKYRTRDEFTHTHPEEARPRMTWGISVPMDKKENGYVILEELFEGCIEKMEQYGLEWGEGKKNRYFALSTVLALFLQHGDAVLSDG